MTSSRIKDIIDYYLAIAVFIQGFFIIFQQIMLDVWQFPEEQATSYRVLLTIITMGPGILFAFFRNPREWLITYLFVFLILLLTILFYPQNEKYLLHDATRFLLPMVIPSALCLFSLKDMQIVDNVVYYSSWLTLFAVFYYVFNMLIGRVLFVGYNMSFSYGVLLPMMCFYSKKRFLHILIAIALFIVVLAIGSRGAALCFFLFVSYDVFRNNKKYIPLYIFLLVVGIASITIFTFWLDDMGISSRTLSLAEEGNLAHVSRRDLIYDKIIESFIQNPVFGCGPWGDRVILDGAYTHNLVLELFLDFGFLAFFALLWLISSIVHALRTSGEIMNLIMYSIALLVPLLFSGSYLISFGFGCYIGILRICNKRHRCLVNK